MLFRSLVFDRTAHDVGNIVNAYKGTRVFRFRVSAY
jgi:hypothetical protein